MIVVAMGNRYLTLTGGTRFSGEALVRRFR